MALAIFDLDNTLLSGDSDYLWGQYLAEIGVVDADTYETINRRFYEEYKQGRLDIFAFLAFSMRPLAENASEDLLRWRARFIEQKILPLIGEPARELVEDHRRAGDTLLIVTATNSFVTSPIAELFDIPNLIGTDPEVRDGRFTGRVAGIPSFREGKVARVQDWLDKTGLTLHDATFYSDSHNDLPLLELVDHPVAVDPDDTLRNYAQAAGWPIISLHEHAPTSA
jgi:HAD superfamily hydrolase (TIGR01490 family)